MNKNLGISILILCFGLSSVNISLASQGLDVPPVIVQPYDVSAMNLQMLELDRENQEQVLAIKGLIDENQKSTNADLAQKQNATLEKINKTIADSQAVSKYDELINLTENVDKMKNVGQTLEMKRDVIQEKYKILTELKNEMTVLNENFRGEKVNENIDQINQDQQEEIQVLTQRLGEMDQKIAHYDEILAEKDQKIAQLKDNLARVQSEAATKDESVKEEKDQVDLLKSELENKIVQEHNRGPQETRMRQQALDLKAKDESIRWLNQVLAVTKNKAEYYKLTSQQDQLSMQQVQGEMQKIKDDFAQHFKDYDHFENAIVSLKNQVSRLGLQLSQKQSQMELLKAQLENKISDKDQGVIAGQIQAGQKTKEDTDSLKQQLVAAQDKAERLKQQLDSKTSESDTMTLMAEEYQKKLESKNNAYNEQFGQLLSFKNYQSKMEKKMADLSAQLQEKEAQVVKIKKVLYNLQALGRPDDMGDQAKDLSLSIMQQKMMAEKIKEVTYLKAELALARQQLKGMTISDEYKKKFKEQFREFQSLKDQLRDARQEIKRKDKKLKYKDMEIAHIKDLYRPRTSEKNLQAQVMALTKKLEAADKRGMSKTYKNKVEALQAQLKRANLEIKDLQAQLKQLRAPSKNDPLEEKLKQALDKINEQGLGINVLNQKLQDCGKSAGPT